MLCSPAYCDFYVHEGLSLKVTNRNMPDHDAPSWSTRVLSEPQNHLACKPLQPFGGHMDATMEPQIHPRSHALRGRHSVIIGKSAHWPIHPFHHGMTFGIVSCFQLPWLEARKDQVRFDGFKQLLELAQFSHLAFH